MSSAGSIQDDSALGVILSISASITTVLLYFSPMSTVLEIYRSKSTKLFPGLPYISMILQSLIWSGYGILVSSPTIYCGNLVGVFIGVMYSIIYHTNATEDAKKERLKLYSGGTFLFVIFCGLFTHGIVNDDPEPLGIFSMVGTISFMISPLVTLFLVCKTNSVESMPFDLSFVIFVNTSFWVIFGWFVADDYTLYITNGLGATSALLQLFCHLLYGDIKTSLKQLLSYPVYGLRSLKTLFCTPKDEEPKNVEESSSEAEYGARNNIVLV
eukprot:snap_masked-scaffold_2-processed-gene-22.8-mRNA-1 protein AED:1.00 eAED:1.00 QI:0/-1/0/0/-1/1/1/0/269